MEIKLTPRKRENTRLYLLLVIFRRLVALALLAFAVMYWMRIVGLSGEGIRFDTMSEDWRATTAILAVLLPITAIGLWGLFPWGTSCWLVAVAFELTLYMGLPERFGENKSVVLFHLITLATYLFIKLIMRIGKRRRMLPHRRPTA